MDYYKLLDFYSEPFSNSPDPEFFYESSSHLDCLQKLEISIRLKRGLCVVLGEVGAGKTTICRKLLRDLKDDPDIETYLILDPSFISSLEMLGCLNTMLRRPDPSERPPSTEAAYKELIKNHLFQKVIKERKTIVLIVDEGQKIPFACQEVLRELLNFETNEYKLLQIVIFAQNEFQDILDRHPNFADRVNQLCTIQPLTLQETAGLIIHRIQRASGYDFSRRPRIRFTRAAVKRIHQVTRGHPRKIINICHRLLMLAIIANKNTITSSMVRSLSKSLPGARRLLDIRKPVTALAGIAAALLVMVGGYIYLPQIKHVSVFQDSTAHVEDSSDAVHSLRIALDSLPEGENRKPVPENAVSPEEHFDYFVIDDDMFVASNHDDQKHPAEIEVPEDLGNITITRDDNLWSILERVYGKANLHLLRIASASNSHISDLEKLQDGERVILPVVNSRSPSPEEKYWIVFKKYSDLNAAYNAMMDTDKYRLRVLPYINTGSSVSFSVAWVVSFESEGQARDVINSLPDEMSSGAGILSLSNNDVLLF